jgi:hypothetical protein
MLHVRYHPLLRPLYQKFYQLGVEPLCGVPMWSMAYILLYEKFFYECVLLREGYPRA